MTPSLSLTCRNTDTKKGLEVCGGIGGMCSNVRVRVSQCLGNQRHSGQRVELAAGSGYVREAKDCIAAHVEVWMLRQLKADSLNPSAIEGGRVEPKHDRNVEQVHRFASSDDRLNISERPLVLERSHEQLSRV
jgi:hypothetical protein